MSRSTGMCESDDGQDDLMSRSTGMCESDRARSADGSPPKPHLYFNFKVYMADITE